MGLSFEHHHVKITTPSFSGTLQFKCFYIKPAWGNFADLRCAASCESRVSLDSSCQLLLLLFLCCPSGPCDVPVELVGPPVASGGGNQW